MSDELCLGVEAAIFLCEGCVGGGTSSSAAGHGASMAALVVLHCMAITKHCLDAAPRVAAVLLRRLVTEESVASDAAAVQAIVTGLQEHLASGVPPSAWPQRFMELAPQAWSHWIVRALTLHKKAKLLLDAPRLFTVTTIHAAKNPELLTPAFSTALVALFSAALASADDGVLSAEHSSLLSSSMLPVLDNLFGDPMPSALVSVVCGSAACMAPKSSLALLQSLMIVDRDAAVMATALDHGAVWSVLQQLCAWTRRWPLADILDLVQRTSLWLAQTSPSSSRSSSVAEVHTLRQVIAEMLRGALSRPDIMGNSFTRDAVVTPLVDAGLAEEFGVESAFVNRDRKAIPC